MFKDMWQHCDKIIGQSAQSLPGGAPRHQKWYDETCQKSHTTCCRSKAGNFELNLQWGEEPHTTLSRYKMVNEAWLLRLLTTMVGTKPLHVVAKAAMMLPPSLQSLKSPNSVFQQVGQEPRPKKRDLVLYPKLPWPGNSLCQSCKANSCAIGGSYSTGLGISFIS